MSLAEVCWKALIENHPGANVVSKTEFTAAFNYAYSRGFSDSKQRAAQECDVIAAKHSGNVTEFVAMDCGDAIRALKESA